MGAAFRGNTLYLTERTGRIVRISGVVDGGTDLEHEAVADFTDEIASGADQFGGLLGLVFHPADSDIAYTYQTHRRDGTLHDRILRHDVANEFQHETIFDGIIASNVHDGGRLVIHDEALYATTGDSYDRPELAQDRTKLAGNVLRLTLDGQPHPKNPFGNAVFTYGHRNPQGLVFRQGRTARSTGRITATRSTSSKPGRTTAGRS
jgi:glucose/arabinose dehydrogenase